MTCDARPSITADTPRPPNDSLYSLQPIRPSSVLIFRKSKLRWPASACRCSIFVTFMPDLRSRSPVPRASPPRRQAPDVARRLAVPGRDSGQTQRPFARVIHHLPEAGRLELGIVEQGLQGVHDHGRDALVVQVGEPLRVRAGGGDLAQLLVQDVDVV